MLKNKNNFKIINSFFSLLEQELFRPPSYMGLRNSPTCRKCGTEKETSVHILCECVALASLRYIYIHGFFILDPEDIRVLGMGAI